MMDVKIIPYTRVDGIPTFKDSEIYNLYIRMVAENKLEKVFYDGSVTSPEGFLQMFNEGDQFLYVFMNIEGKFLGFFWINHFEGPSCRIHFCMFNSAGKNIIKLAKMGLEFLGKYFRPLIGITPINNKVACKLIQKCGCISVGVMPEMIYNYYKQQNEEALISYYLRKEDENGGW